MLIGLVKGLTPINFIFLRSKVKVTRLTCKNWCPLNFFRTVYQRAFSYVLIGLSEEKPLLDFGFTRSKVKVTNVTIVKNVNKVFAYYLDNC